MVVWLWNHHEDDFQTAFSKSGRVDVDPTCKWLTQAAVDVSVRALGRYIVDSGIIAGTGKGEKAMAGTEDSHERTMNLDTIIATRVSKALTMECSVNAEVVSDMGTVLLAFTQ